MHNINISESYTLIMDNIVWNYGNLSDVHDDLLVFNTMYVDNAAIESRGLVCSRNGRAVGFVSIYTYNIFFKKIFISKSGILLVNNDFFSDAVSSLKKFIIKNNLLIVFNVDYCYYKKLPRIDKNICFLGNKKTIVNSIDRDENEWLMSIRPKHRHSVRKGLKGNHQCYVKSVDNMSLLEIKKLYDIYVENMNFRKAVLLFSTQEEFINFIERNLKNTFFTFCYKGGKLAYFNVIHTNYKIANYIMAVTTKSGMASYASYAGVYELYNYLYKNEFNFLNFGGIDPINNHVVYFFKKGFSGEIVSIPKYIAIGGKFYMSIMSRVAKFKNKQHV